MKTSLLDSLSLVTYEQRNLSNNADAKSAVMLALSPALTTTSNLVSLGPTVALYSALVHCRTHTKTVSEASSGDQAVTHVLVPAFGATASRASSRLKNESDDQN